MREGGTVNARQRYLETMKFGKPDRAFLLHPWLWTSTLERWHTEGLPPDVHVDEYFGTDRYETVPVRPACSPRSSARCSSEGETRIVRRAGEGQIIREFTERPDMNMPQWLDYPLKTREDWEREFKPRLDPALAGPLSALVGGLRRGRSATATTRSASAPARSSAGSATGWGSSGSRYMLFDDPRSSTRWSSTSSWSSARRSTGARRRSARLRADVGGHGRARAARSCSPRTFREFQVPAYKRVTGLLRDHGVDVIMVD